MKNEKPWYVPFKENDQNSFVKFHGEKIWEPQHDGIIS